MSALILSLIFFTLPAQAQEATGGLQCQYDANNPKDPYAKMKKENEDKIAAGIKSMGITVGRLPRQDMITGLNSHLVQLCWAKKSMENMANSITAKKKEADTVAAGQQGCEAYSSINRQLDSFKLFNKNYQETLTKALREQRGRYQKFIKDDEKALQAHKQNPAVVKSFREAWGKLPHEKGEGGSAILTDPITQIKEEQDLNGSREGGYNNLASSIQALKEKCPSLATTKIGDEDIKASAKKPGGDEWGLMSTNTETSTDTSTDTESAVDTGQYQPETPPYVPPQNDGEVPPPQKVEKEGWISRNKGPLLLGVGAAAVVGGVLWYKHEQDKKTEETNDWIQAQVKASTATVTSTATSTSTNPETTTLSVTGFPQSAAVNYVIPKITVSVKGPNKDGVQVSIACVNSCSLAGTLTKTTAGGTAEFTDLYFTAPHEGVQLRVSAPNLNSVASPGSFNVIEAGRE